MGDEGLKGDSLELERERKAIQKKSARLMPFRHVNFGALETATLLFPG